MNVWIESLLDAQDLRRRSDTQDQWMRENPAVGAFSRAWAERNLPALGDRIPKQ